MKKKVLIRGGGDLASGVALRLIKTGMDIYITELPQPFVVRRTVSFAEAVYEGTWIVEGISAIHVRDVPEADSLIKNRCIPVLVDPNLERISEINPDILVDGRMLKLPVEYNLNQIDLIIGLGPGFQGGKNCHAFVETNRGHFLGRVFWEGMAEENSGIPGSIMGIQDQRVLRSPQDGVFNSVVSICDVVNEGQPIGWIGEKVVLAPFSGLIRGLIHDGLMIKKNMKIGDIDPRIDRKLCTLISEKALAIGGGVLEAILTVDRPTRK
jgi:xanthine dehydrogenase accessory factor